MSTPSQLPNLLSCHSLVQILFSNPETTWKFLTYHAVFTLLPLPGRFPGPGMSPLFPFCPHSLFLPLLANLPCLWGLSRHFQLSMLPLSPLWSDTAPLCSPDALRFLHHAPTVISPWLPHWTLGARRAGSAKLCERRISGLLRIHPGTHWRLLNPSVPHSLQSMCMSPPSSWSWVLAALKGCLCVFKGSPIQSKFHLCHSAE